jgi:hypothetical protein
MSKARDLADFQGSASALTTGTLPVDRVPYVGRRNLIINGGFDVWQRGTGPFVGTSIYGADRWTNIADSSISTSQGVFPVGQTDVPNNPKYYASCSVTTNSSADEYKVYGQRLEGVSLCSGNTVTVSFYAKADGNKDITLEFYQQFGGGGTPSANVGGIGVTKFSLTTNWQKFTATVDIPSLDGKTIGTDGNNSLICQFWMSAGSNLASRTDSLPNQSGVFDFAQVQLELGSVATPFEHRSYGEELALCQRYFQAYDQPPLRGVAQVSDQIYRMGMVIPQMRTSPSASLTDYLNWYDSSGTGSCTIKVNYSTKYLCELDFDITSGSTAGGRPVCIYQLGTSGHMLYLDAEL